MAWMDMDCNLKELFNALSLKKLATIQIMVYSLFTNSLDVFLLVFWKHFVSDKGT